MIIIIESASTCPGEALSVCVKSQFSHSIIAVLSMFQSQRTPFC